MIWRFHDLLTGNPWSGDLWSDFFVIHFVFNHCYLLIHYDPKLHWISIYAFISFRTVVINRNSPLLWLKANFRFSTVGVQNAPGGRASFFSEQLACRIKDWPADLWGWAVPVELYGIVKQCFFFFYVKKRLPSVKIFAFPCVKIRTCPWKNIQNSPWKINSLRENFFKFPYVKSHRLVREKFSKSPTWKL